MSMIHPHDRLGAPTQEELDNFVERGIHIDSYGRPINPNQAYVLGTHGLRLGKGDFWNWGPNYTVDPVVIGDDNGTPKVLTIVRSDNSRTALPGGFIDAGETPGQAAIREALEETGIDISGDPHEVIYHGGVNDPRDTIHSWAETTAILFRHGDCPKATAGDDAKPDSARWLSTDELSERQLHAAHAMIIAKAMQRYDELIGKIIH